MSAGMCVGRVSGGCECMWCGGGQVIDGYVRVMCDVCVCVCVCVRARACVCVCNGEGAKAVDVEGACVC